MACRRRIKLEAFGSHEFDNLRGSRSYPLTLGFICRLTEENRQSYFFFSNVDFSALIVLNLNYSNGLKQRRYSPCLQKRLGLSKIAFLHQLHPVPSA